jgi:FKBP12-rapamycin complex-associated protein
MRTCPVGLQEYYFQNLGQLISMVKQHVRNHLGPIMTTIRDFWTLSTNPGLQIIIIDVIQSIAIALDAEFKAYLPNLLPLMLEAFEHDLSEPRRQNSLVKVLHAFGIFGSSLEEYLHLIIPAIVGTFERPEVPLLLRKQAMQTVSQLCRKINFADHASRIIHPLARVLSSATAPPELRIPAMDAMCALLVQMGSDFVLFVPMINKVSRARPSRDAGLTRSSPVAHPQPHRPRSVRDARHEAAERRGAPSGHRIWRTVSPLLSSTPLTSLTHRRRIIIPSNEATVAADAGVSKLPVNQVNLKSAWEPVDRAKADDWREWMKRLSVQLLKSSPSLSLRACANLAEVYHPLARDLFNAAFVSCWSELYDQYQVRPVLCHLGSDR